MKAMNGETVEKIDYSNSASPKKGVLEEFVRRVVYFPYSFKFLLFLS